MHNITTTNLMEKLEKCVNYVSKNILYPVHIPKSLAWSSESLEKFEMKWNATVSVQGPGCQMSFLFRGDLDKIQESTTIA